MRFPICCKKEVILWIVFCIILATMFTFKFIELRSTCLSKDERSNALLSMSKEQHMDRKMPLIFIGGMPSSGSTLMSVMLDAHPDVRCGQETRIITHLLQLHTKWQKSAKESLRLQEAGIPKEVVNSATAAFLLEIIAKNGKLAPRLCTKEPLTMKMATFVMKLFPNAKFIFMVRDGRASMYSLMSRNDTTHGFNLSNYRQCIRRWNGAIEVMHTQCKSVGKEHCMMVYYEQLVLHPEEWMREILSFVDIPWNDAVLHHERFINKPNGTQLSDLELQWDQITKSVNFDSLTRWVGHIPEDVVRDMADLAPMLSVLGYDPYSNAPNYENPNGLKQKHA